MKKVFGICDLDKSYVEVLSRYISRKEGNEFNVVGFSKTSALAEFTMHEKFDVLLISVSFIEEMNSITASEDVIPKSTFILTEENEPGGFKFPEIYKYQSTEYILREIRKSIGGLSSGSYGKLKGNRITCVYSVVGRCGKTQLAIREAKRGAERESTLLLSLDSYHVDNLFDEEDECYGVSDLLYMSATNMTANRDAKCIRVEDERLKKEGDLSILVGARCSEDIRGTSEKDIATCIKVLKSSSFQKIVIDVGSDIRNPECILEECDEIIVPCSRDDVSVKKIKRWETELKKLGKENILGRIRKVMCEG